MENFHDNFPLTVKDMLGMKVLELMSYSTIYVSYFS